MAIYFGVLGLGSFPNALQVSVSVGLSYSDIDKIPRAMRYLPRYWSYLIGPVIKFVISIVLIIGPDKVIGLLSRFDRTFKRVGTPENTNDDDGGEPPN